MWLVLSLQLARFHTLTVLSQPADTMMGFSVLGEKRTHDTQSVWPSSVIVYLHTPSVFHSLMVLSREPDTIWRLSAENATLITSLLWSTKRRVDTPVLRSHSRRLLSHEPDSAKLPSDDITTSVTKWPCPLS